MPLTFCPRQAIGRPPPEYSEANQAHLVESEGGLQRPTALDTTTPHGELLFHIFGALAQYERALTKERVNAGLAAAKRRGRMGGRPAALSPEKLEAVIAALNSGTTKAAVCRNFSIPRSTLLDSLARAGWTGPGGVARSKAPRTRKSG